MSRAARLKWVRLECQVEGVLERVERTPQFTRFLITANLVVPAGTNVDAWVDKYCQEHPVDKIQDAAASLVDELSKTK